MKQSELPVSSSQAPPSVLATSESILSPENVESNRIKATRHRIRLRAVYDPDENESSDPGERTDGRVIWSQQLSLLLCGTRDPNSTLFLLQGLEDSIIRLIYMDLVSCWKQSVTRTLPASQVGRMNADVVALRTGDSGQITTDQADLDYHRFPSRVQGIASVVLRSAFSYSSLGMAIQDRPQIAYTSCGFISFPDPLNRNVNMMPFILGDRNSLPHFLHPYYDSCIRVCPVMPEELGKVCYLTVAEGFVRANDSQRREGLHVECPGAFGADSKFVAAVEHHWGCGLAYSPDELHGGLFISSNMDATCAVWDALVDTKTGAVDHLGGMENLRPYLGNARALLPNELIWLTDKTPHEALPQLEDGYRQFFRLVTSKVSVWFEDHSTPNPFVPLPDHVKIIKGNKFID